MDALEQRSGTLTRATAAEMLHALDPTLDPSDVRSITINLERAEVECYSTPRRIEGDSVVTYRRYYAWES